MLVFEILSIYQIVIIQFLPRSLTSPLRTFLFIPQFPQTNPTFSIIPVFQQPNSEQNITLFHHLQQCLQSNNYNKQDIKMSNQLSSSTPTNPQSNSKLLSNGRWTPQQHNLFLQGISKYGNNWKKIEEMIQTRNGSQIRSHAQKYFNKINQKMEKKEKIMGHEEMETCLPNSNCFGHYPQMSDLDRILTKSFIKSQEDKIIQENNFIKYLGSLDYLSCFGRGEAKENGKGGNNSYSYFSEKILITEKQIESLDFYKMFVDIEREKRVEIKEESKGKSSISFVPWKHTEDNFRREDGRDGNMSNLCSL